MNKIEKERQKDSSGLWSKSEFSNVTSFNEEMMI